jgi:galactokinase
MPISVSAHGRVNLIGDHTDYTGGLVLPMLLDCRTEIVGERIDEPRWTLRSDSEPEPARIDLPAEVSTNDTPHWARYPAGVLAVLAANDVEIAGFRGSVSTTIPIGGGLSSSAALEVAVARVALGDRVVDPTTLAKWCREAEHLASGVPCGIMDQLVIAAGTPGRALLIDCRSLTTSTVTLPDDVEVEVRFVAPRTLAGSEYADRVADCRAVEDLIGPLRDAAPESVEEIGDERLRRRARHVISENRRVLDFVDAITHGDIESAGRLMTASHESLSADYQTSNSVMDRAVSEMLTEPDVLGARMTGGGFGGCVVALRRHPRT